MSSGYDGGRSYGQRGGGCGGGWNTDSYRDNRDQRGSGDRKGGGKGRGNRGGDRDKQQRRNYNNREQQSFGHERGMDVRTGSRERAYGPPGQLSGGGAVASQQMPAAHDHTPQNRSDRVGRPHPASMTAADHTSQGRTERAVRQSPPASDASADADPLRAAVEFLDQRDVTQATRILMKVAKSDHTVVNVRTDPLLTDCLNRYNNIFQSAEQYGQTIQPRDLADLAFSLGKFQRMDDLVNQVLQKVAQLARFRSDQLTPHDIAGMVWGFASLGMRHEALMSVIAAEVVNKRSGFDQRHLSNTAWAFAKCGLWNEHLVNAIASESMCKMDTFTTQSLSHISWAMAQWGTRKDELLNAIAEEVIRKIREFQPPPLAMTAWSFASLGVKNTKLMKVISDEAIEKIGNFKTQDLAHLAWAFANLWIQDIVLFNKMADRILKHVSAMQAPELANIAWSFSKTNLTHETLMTAIAQESAHQIRTFKPAEVAMLTWAFAVAGQQHQPLMAEIGSSVAKSIRRYSPPQLSHISWAFGALSLRHMVYLKSLSSHVQHSLNTFKPSALSNIAWAFAMVSYRDEHLLRLIAPLIARDASELKPLSLTRCAWAYRMLAVHSHELVEAICQEALRKLGDFATKALVKLIDSLQVSPVLSNYGHLDAALDERMETVADVMKEHFPDAESLSADNKEYVKGLESTGLADCGFSGTPQLLKHLDISMPERDFMLNCRKQAWKDAEGDSEHISLNNPETSQGTVLECNISFGGQDLHQWIVRDATYASREQEEKDGYIAIARNTFAMGIASHQAQHASIFLALAAVCAIISGMGVDLKSPDDCTEVTGSLRAISFDTPCLSSIGILWQFKSRFPGIKVEFVEQVSEPGSV